MKCPQCGGITFSVTPTALVGHGAGANGMLVCRDCGCLVDGWTVSPKPEADATP